MSNTVEIADPERALALAYAPAEARPALSVLWRLDERLAEIVRTTTEPMIGQMRLTWWHDALTSLGDRAAPAEPLLVDVARLIPDPAALLPLIEGWEELLQPFPLDEEALGSFARNRGGALFACAAALLGGGEAAAAGEGWALVDLAFHCSDRTTAERALALARPKLEPRRWPRALRPLGILATLARRDALAGLAASRRVGSPGRVTRALWHGVTGR